MRPQLKSALVTLILLLTITACQQGSATIAPQPTATQPLPTVVPTEAPLTATDTFEPTSPPSTATHTPEPTLPPPTATFEEVLSPYGYTEVRFTTEDGLTLAGRLFGQGDFAVILTHQGYATQDTWINFAHTLANLDYTVLTMDFRGNGQSEGPLTASLVVRDVQAAYDFLYARGYEQIACMGASFGGTACLKAGVTKPLAGIAIIASRPNEGPPTTITAKDYPVLTMPKLFTYGIDDKDGYIHGHMTNMFEQAIEPKEIVTFPESVHGTDLFYTSSGEAFRELLINFLDGLRADSN